MSSRPPPKRNSSLEMTAVIDTDKTLSERARAALARAAEVYPSVPPDSTVGGPTLDQLGEIARARRELADSVETLVPCPCCAACRTCHGEHMVSHAVAAEYAREHPKSDPPEAA